MQTPAVTGLTATCANVLAFVAMLEGARVLLGVTGSIAAYKAAVLARGLLEAGAQVQVLLTEGGARFVTAATFQALTGRSVITDWDGQAEIAHVEEAHRADLVIVAPATAHLVARWALGLADDPLTATLLSYPGPAMVAPAMETNMWRSPATRAHVETLRARGVEVVGPGTGGLASGRAGEGRMAEPQEIVGRARVLLAKGPLHGLRFVITAGPTREPLDPVRFLSNRSTGAMGIALADEASRRGAEVDLILGPTHLSPVRSVKLHRVETAEQMNAAVESLEGSHVFVGAAAVSDHRPSMRSNHKLKKERKEAGASIELSENPDILARVGAARGTLRLVVGFAAETDALIDNARSKLRAKRADAIVANWVGPDAGFGDGRTEVHWVTEEAAESSGLVDKVAAARFVLDRISDVVRQPEHE